MKPAWDSLMDEYKESKTALVADVDCTAEGKSLCEKVGVSGYPTIKYGDPSDLQDYSGGRSLDELKKFADENLGPTCGPDNLDLCDEADKKMIAKVQKQDIDELEISIEEGDAKIKALDAKHQKVIDKVQAEIKNLHEKIDKEQKKKEDAIAKESKKLNLNFKKAVLASMKKAKEDQDPDLE
jgi:uncharacterized coiled-coil protein SlyX